MKRLLICTSFILLLVGCKDTALEAELKDTKSKLAGTQTRLEGTQAKLEESQSKVVACQESQQAMCTKLETLAHEQRPQSFEVGEDTLVDVPCGEIKVKAYKVDSERGWTYLRYEVGDDTRFSDRLLYEDKPDRNSVLVRHDSFEGAVLLSVDSCRESECKVTCRALSNTHAPTCQ